MATINSERILNFLKANYGKEFSKQDIADELGVSFPAVTGTMTSLVKKGYATTTREEVVEIQPATETRKAKTRVIKYHTLTEAGLSYDPVAEEQAAKEAKAAEKAAKAAERKARRQAAEEF